MGSKKVALTFVIARRVAKVIHNLEVRDVFADEFFAAVLRLDTGMLEVRASHDRARQLANTWLVEFAELLEE